MLVLSRRLGESICLPELGIEIHVNKISGSRVAIGVEAPADVAIVRGERLDRHGVEFDLPSRDRLGERQVLEMEAEIEQIADMAQQHCRPAARQASETMVAKLRSLHRTQVAETQCDIPADQPKRLGDYVTLPIESESIVRQPAASYSVA